MATFRPASGLRKRRRQNGVAATEFVIVLPLLLLLTTTAVDCGRFAYSYIALSNAVRVGAEFGATQTMSSYNQQSWTTSVQSAMYQEMSGVPNFQNSQLAVTIAIVTANYGLQQVTVSGTYNFVPLLSWPGTGSSVPMQRTLCMRQFR